MWKKATSPLIAGVLYFAIIMGAISIILSVIYPFVEDSKNQIAINYARKNIADIDSIISSIALQEQDAAKIIDLYVSNGKYKIDEGKNAVYFQTNVSPNIFSTRFRTKTGNVFFGTQLNSESIEYDDYFILENSYLIVNISKKGNDENYQDINTSKIINSIYFKEKKLYLYQQNISIIPDNCIDQESGIGYVYLKEKGFFLPRAIAVARMIKANNNASFDIYFELPSDSDFLLIYLKNYNI
ncbi:MAG: hypothetical protein B6U87_01450 [Candidatus Aenigmarchaeota archaeon ex4484_52]|nr:MAG: hypothetical protein B6U87_01450 [Candidatus Aenigmarchaeota archaeon ex4484_52]